MATSKTKAKKKSSASKKVSTIKKTKSKKKPATKAGKATSKKRGSTIKVSDAEKQKMIEESAYYIAQQRHFQPGNDIDDWLKAEKIVNKLL